MAVTESSTHDYKLRDPDVRLMLEVRDDNAAAFEELMVRYQDRVLMVLQHLVRKRDQAEDLAQEVFLRVYRARKRYRPNAKFSTWLFTIANNVASNANRSLARKREVSVGGHQPNSDSGPQLEHIALDASGLMPTRQLDTAERAEIVQQAIQTLNQRQRMALMLSKFEGMSYVDIAETMGLTVQATKSLLSRARENLRTILEPYFTEGARPAERSES